jgi:rhodanese-related sulfurtransferase
MSLPSEISVAELRRMRAANDAFLLVDVREDDELATASLDGVLHIPMDEVGRRLSELPKDADIVVMCHSGGRSGRVSGRRHRCLVARNRPVRTTVLASESSTNSR